MYKRQILRLHALFGSVYPGTLGLAGTCFVVLAPVIYLRREPALRQTANALLVFGAACMAIRVFSVAPRPVSYTHLDGYKRQGLCGL